jgi:hypothetical protein
MADAFSGLLGDRRGARRPVDEGASDPRVIPLKQPGEGWHVCLLRDHNELLLNIGELGLAGDDEYIRALMSEVAALLVYALRENPAMSDEELDELATHGLDTFRAMPLDQRPYGGRLAPS